MENLFDQVYKDGFVVNQEKPMFVKLSTNMKLGTNIDRAQTDYSDNPNKLYHINKGLGFQTSLPKTEYTKVKEANNLLKKDEPKIQHKEITEYEEMRRINLQIQNRLNERSLNIIDTAYAPQGLTPNQVMALSSTKPKLQKEIEAINEYAKTHFLSKEETQKLKDEVVKQNYRQWKNNVDIVKRQQGGDFVSQTLTENEGIQPTNEGIQPTNEGVQPTNTEPEQFNFISRFFDRLTGFEGVDDTEPTQGQAQPSPAPTPAPAPAPAPATAPVEAQTPQRRQPIPTDVDEGDKPIVNPTRPIKIDNSKQVQDKEIFPNSYIDDNPIVNFNAIPNNVNYAEMVKIYFEKYFLLEFQKGTSLKTLNSANNFIRYFQQNNRQGQDYLKSRFFDKNFNFTQYIQRFIASINEIYNNVMKTKTPFFYVETTPSGSFRPYRTQQQRVRIPTSDLQQQIFINVMVNFLSECRKIIIKNIEILYLSMDDNDTLKFNRLEDLQKLKKDVRDGKIIGKQLLGIKPLIQPELSDVQKDRKELKDLNNKITTLEGLVKEKEEQKKKAEAKGDMRSYRSDMRKKHEELIEELKEAKEEKKKLLERIGNTGGGSAAGAGGGVDIVDGEEIVIDV